MSSVSVQVNTPSIPNEGGKTSSEISLDKESPSTDKDLVSYEKIHSAYEVFQRVLEPSHQITESEAFYAQREVILLRRGISKEWGQGILGKIMSIFHSIVFWYYGIASQYATLKTQCQSLKIDLSKGVEDIFDDAGSVEVSEFCNVLTGGKNNELFMGAPPINGQVILVLDSLYKSYYTLLNDIKSSEGIPLVLQGEEQTSKLFELLELSDKFVDLVTEEFDEYFSHERQSKTQTKMDFLASQKTYLSKAVLLHSMAYRSIRALECVNKDSPVPVYGCELDEYSSVVDFFYSEEADLCKLREKHNEVSQKWIKLFGNEEMTKHADTSYIQWLMPDLEKESFEAFPALLPS